MTHTHTSQRASLFERFLFFARFVLLLRATCVGVFSKRGYLGLENEASLYLEKFDRSQTW
jgi:hypothetical protein